MSDSVQRVQERAGEVGRTTRDEAGAVTEKAKEQAGAVAEEAKHEAMHLVDDARQQLRDEAASQTQRAATSLRELGEQLDRIARGEAPGEGPANDLAQHAADGVHRLADTLQGRRPEDLLSDVKRFARQRPGMFLAGAVGAGFLAGRVLRSSSGSQGQQSQHGQHGQQGYQHESVTGPGSLGALGGAGTSNPLEAGGTAPAGYGEPTATPTGAPAGAAWRDDQIGDVP